MLLRCAGMLYGHILEVLRIVDSTDSSVGRDYSRVLLKHLLANPAYTTQMPSSTANGST